MTLLDKLDTLRNGHGAVESATYFDIASRTVLVTSARVRPAQERLDGLCALTRTLLDDRGAAAAAAVSLRATEALIVRRAPTAPSEALCLVCAPDVDVDAVLADAGAALAAAEG